MAPGGTSLLEDGGVATTGGVTTTGDAATIGCGADPAGTSETGSGGVETGDVHLPASHTRSPLQSMSFVHCACATKLESNIELPLNRAQTARPRIARKLAALAAFRHWGLN
jgi:hypothetical protein